ncbi:hypothetical protein GGU10DRAFT_330151 [Lentinula aff. detonsa]|uniref:Uncharacterized protein n=1 Tax=Lentinula aff. detonsa TaxID=2804958 RepID=A0AA38NQH0_9AGAR|nr:hypothetical protein GGU10DRAFT_330151 [Lentinula aff. detonsa]
MYLCGLDIRAGLSFRVCAVLFLGLVCAAFTAALPLSDNDLSNPTSSVHLAARNELKKIPMTLRFIKPEDKLLHQCESLSKDKTVKQIQAYLERMQTGFGFVPTISVEDAEGEPWKYVPRKSVSFDLELKDFTEESEEIRNKWGTWNMGTVQISSPFLPRSAIIQQGTVEGAPFLIYLSKDNLRIIMLLNLIQAGKPSVTLAPATISNDLL